MTNTPHIVWLTEHRHFAELIEQHAHHSVVRYSRGKYEYEMKVENDEWEEVFDYEQD